MKKHIPFLLSLFFVLLYILWLFFTGLHFMPSSGYRIHDRPVSEASIMTGRDRSDSHSSTRELLPNEKVNINTADAETLQLLSGIGPALASAIVEYRLEHGSFQSIDELLQVPGIGEKRFAAIYNNITVGGSE